VLNPVLDLCRSLRESSKQPVGCVGKRFVPVELTLLLFVGGGVGTDNEKCLHLLEFVGTDNVCDMLAFIRIVYWTKFQPFLTNHSIILVNSAGVETVTVFVTVTEFLWLLPVPPYCCKVRASGKLRWKVNVPLGKLVGNSNCISHTVGKILLPS